MAPGDHVGGVAPMSSLNAARICGPASEKLVQLMRTRPVSGSTSRNSLSAASPGPAGLVAAVTSNGPCQVWPQSVERCTPIVCALVVPSADAVIKIEPYTKVQAPTYLTVGSPKTSGNFVPPTSTSPGVGSCPPSTKVCPPSSE